MDLKAEQGLEVSNYQKDCCEQGGGRPALVQNYVKKLDNLQIKDAGDYKNLY